ncbi:MAG: hypothetical protein ACE10C_03480, partial [Candidatus Binatia bacterium]
LLHWESLHTSSGPGSRDQMVHRPLRYSQLLAAGEISVINIESTIVYPGGDIIRETDFHSEI